MAAIVYKDTPLHHAACKGHSGAVQLLLTAKSNPNAEGNVSTPLIPAMWLDDWNLSCLVDWLQKSQNTPLHDAVKNGHSEVVQLLKLANEGLSCNLQ